MGNMKNRAAIIAEIVKRTPKSGKYFEEAQDSLPGGLISGARKMTPYPIYVDHAKGAYAWDIDGNKYIDNTMSYGVHVLGHGPDILLKALHAQMDTGISYGTPHIAEVEYTKKLIKCIPCAEQVMLCNSGTEATLLAWRVMRAASGKQKIAKFEGCYHGWHDYAQWSVGIDPDKMGPVDRPNKTPGSAGIPDGARDNIILLPFTDAAFDIIKEHAHELAGVAIEPIVGGGDLVVDTDFMKKLREVTRKNNVLLHHDEVITGFRVGLGGCQEIHGVIPDIATYGKAIGGGIPVGAVACSKKLVATAKDTDDGFSAAGTFSGNPLCLAGGMAFLDYMMENKDIYSDMKEKGEYLRGEFNKYAKSKGYPFCMTGYGSMFQLHAMADIPVVPRDLLNEDEELLDDLQLQFRLNGLMAPWMHLSFFSAAHTQEDIDAMLTAYKASADGVMEGRK